MGEYDKWFNSLPKHTQIWLKNQPLWHDIDVIKVFIGGILVGLVIGLIL